MLEWAVYERVTGPLGPQRSDFHAAQVALMIASANRKKGAKRLRLTDFLLKWGQKEERGRPDGDEDIETPY